MILSPVYAAIIVAVGSVGLAYFLDTTNIISFDNKFLITGITVFVVGLVVLSI